MTPNSELVCKSPGEGWCGCSLHLACLGAAGHREHQDDRHHLAIGEGPVMPHTACTTILGATHNFCLFIGCLLLFCFMPSKHKSHHRKHTSKPTPTHTAVKWSQATHRNNKSIRAKPHHLQSSKHYFKDLNYYYYDMKVASFIKCKSLAYILLFLKILFLQIS